MILHTFDRSLRGVALCLLSLFCTALAGCNSGVDAPSQAAAALALLEENRIPEARQAILAAIEEREEEPEFHLLRGRIEVAAGNWEGAYNAYNDTVALDPQNMEALQAISQLGLRTGHLQQSRKATETILLLSPAQPQALVIMGFHAMMRNRLDEAEQYADQALDGDAQNVGGVVLKARILFRKSDVEGAYAVLTRYEEANGASVETALTRLEMARAQRDTAAMTEQFQTLRRMRHHDPALQLDEADLAFKTGSTNDGLALTTTLLAQPGLSPTDISTVIGLWREYGVNEISVSALASIIRTGSSAARLASANYLAEHGQVDQAGRLIAGLAGSDKAALDARLVALRGHHREAASMLTRVLDQDPTNCMALTAKAAIDARQGDFARSLLSAQRATTQCPDSSMAWILAARAYAQREDEFNARRMFQQGIEANPQDSVLAGSFVEWLQEQGRNREAINVVRRITRNAPALLSGWRLFRDTCRKAGDSCAGAAEEGLAAARTRHGIDPPPGERLSSGLFGRFELK